MVFRSLAVKTKIPLNPPLKKGDFLSPPFLRGFRGDLLSWGVRRTFDSWTIKRSIILAYPGAAAYFHADCGVC